MGVRERCCHGVLNLCGVSLFTALSDGDDDDDGVQREEVDEETVERVMRYVAISFPFGHEGADMEGVEEVVNCRRELSGVRKDENENDSIDEEEDAVEVTDAFDALLDDRARRRGAADLTGAVTCSSTTVAAADVVPVGTGTRLEASGCSSP